jgi:3',5'-cyclic AMP phosphodiesterase CpdA
VGTNDFTRRQFLQASAALALSPVLASPAKPIRFAIIADLHHGLQPDAERRLAAFMEATEGRDLDFIVQMGDFCHPTPGGRALMRLWDQFKGPRRHVLGNHDMDLGTKRQIMDVWGMAEPHYAFDAGAFRFVVLDCNFILKGGKHEEFANGNYYIDSKLRDRVSPEQIEWLRGELAGAKSPVVILSHQALDEVWTGYTVPNRLEVRRVIDEANERSLGRVIACLCGHHHLDEASVIRGVHYLHVNSASYHWVGDGFGSGGRAVYHDPLFAFATLDPAGTLQISGRASTFEEPTPVAAGFPNGERLKATISDRTLRF